MTLIVDGTTGVTFNDSSLQGAAASPYVLKNRIINGDMRIDQRNAGASYSVTAGVFGYVSLDRYRVNNSTDGAFTLQQSTTAPTGFSNSLIATVTTTDTSIAAGQFAILQQNIEGFNVADLGFGTAGASTITLSFWVRSSITGTFTGALLNSATNRSYPFSYTINSANTFELKTITVVGDTTGTWLTNNGIGLTVIFALACGSTFTGTAGSWAGATYLGATGQTNLLGTNGATFYITGVQLEIGTSATPFERRLYTTELQLCQRYFEKSFNISQAVANGTSGTSFISGYGLSAFACSNNSAPGGTIRFAVQKRTDPTMTLYGNNSGQWSLVNPTSSTSISWTTAINLSAGDGIVLVGNYAVNNTLMCVYGHWTASAEL